MQFVVHFYYSLLLSFTTFALTTLSYSQQCLEDNDNDNDLCDGHEVVDLLCQDSKKQCSVWADLGHCLNNANFMVENCPLSCGLCSNDDTDNDNDDDDFLDEGETGDELSNNFDLFQVAAMYGKPQTIPPSMGSERDKVVDTLRSSFQYMEDFKLKRKTLFDNCKNDHEQCAFWASIGECDANPSYMKISCAPACQTCAHLDIKERCSFTEDEFPLALNPGDLDALYYDIVNGMWDEYYPIIHSAPSDYKRSNKTSIVDDSNVELGGPWIVTFDQFLTHEESDRLIELGYAEGYARSTDVGATKFDGTHEKKVSGGRTSENAWCMKKCAEDPTVLKVSHRIGNVTGIPYTYSENFQILRYEENQKYNPHHDYIPHHTDLPSGVRILTFFLYLSDVEEGGQTKFNSLKLEITPKKGRALLWPSVKNDTPNNKEPRTMHEARPVIKGKKYAANLWIHNREFRKAHDMGCTG